MIYPIAITKDEDSCYGVIVPDLKGCYSAGDSIEEAIQNTREAIDLYLEDFAELGKTIHEGSTAEHFVNDEDYEGAVWMLLEFDVTPYYGKSMKVNVTLPELLIKRIDEKVSSEPEIKSRSGFLQRAALDSLNAI